jgi:type I restriction enzyme R subunit
MLVQKYHDSHSEDKEILINIQKAIDSSPEMRSKKALIENFIKGINEVDDVLDEWRSYVAEEKEKAIKTIIETENLKEAETRKFISTAFETGSIKTTGTDVDKILPPISRFGSGNRDEKRKTVLARLLEFFERFFGIV